MRSNRAYAEAVALLSLAAILLEVSYTRIFSFKLYYYFTYLIIGLALLGGGSGGVAVAMLRRLRAASLPATLGGAALAAGIGVVVGYQVIARTPVNAGTLARVVGWSTLFSPTVLAETAKLLLICAWLFVPFFAVGIALSKTFAARPERIGRLYFADLAGAGLACVVAVPLLAWLTPPVCVHLAGLLFTGAALRIGPPGLAFRAVTGAVLAVVAAGVALPGLLPDPIADKEKTLGQVQRADAAVVFSRWHPVFRVDVLPSPADDDTLFLAHDGMWGSIMRRFEGDPGKYPELATDVRSLPFQLTGEGADVAIIGAAGGHEILASLAFEARHVSAVELNPVTVGLLRGEFADFTGRLGEHPAVDLVNDEARSFLSRTERTYDLVWFVAPDSYAAMNAATAGAFVLSESYLYTAEMIALALGRLQPGGIVCAQFGEVFYDERPMRTARYLSTVRHALGAAGVRDVARHVLVATTSAGGPVYSTILVKATPFTPAEVARFTAAVGRVEDSRVRHPNPDEPQEHPVAKILHLPADELAAWYDGADRLLGPVTDEAPFFWHFVRFRDALGVRQSAFNPEESTGERLLLIMLAVATVFAAACLLAPLVPAGALWPGVPLGFRLAVYFGAIGVGFILLEIGLIQRLTLFLGYPTHTLTVSLSAILVSSGLGSLLSSRYQSRSAVLGLAVVLGAIVLCYAFALGPLTRHLMAWPFGVRVAVVALIVFPVGLCLGAFMPLGIRTVAALTDEPTAAIGWAWAVNGFCSVVGSVLATMVAMAFGFQTLFLLGGALYALAVAVLLTVTPAVRDTARTDRVEVAADAAAAAPTRLRL